MGATVDAAASGIGAALDGTPHMSPNCWAVIESTILGQPGCRYLEWGSGNSTIAMLRALLARPDQPTVEITSVEHDRAFANAMVAALGATFVAAGVEATVRIEPLAVPAATWRAALGRDDALRRYESRLLPALWQSRNDALWISSAAPERAHEGRAGGVRRQIAIARCRLGYRYEQLGRATGRGATTPVYDGGTTAVTTGPELLGPTRVVFESGPVRLTYLHLPPMRNRIWKGGPILDGLYREFASYVSVPGPGPYDVVLVDGRARVSCLRRVRHDGLLAPGGDLFLHDAHRPFQHEALPLFQPWSWIRGLGADADSPGSPTPPLVHSGSSAAALETTFDRELFVYHELART